MYVAKQRRKSAAPLQLICTFVFAYAKSRFSFDVALILMANK